MILSLVGLLALCTMSAPPAADSLADLYARGRTWPEFLDAARARKTMWIDNYERGSPAEELVARANAVPGRWRLLVVAEDWCGDSANTVPYLVRLVERVPSLELRIVNSKDGRWVMEEHRTEDGRAATPTVLLLDDRFSEHGCFVERPLALRQWVAEHKPKLSEDEYQAGKMAWYRDDRGAHTVEELVAMLEAASAGRPRCDRPN